jgi:hypothetical protein
MHQSIEKHLVADVVTNILRVIRRVVVLGYTQHKYLKYLGRKEGSKIKDLGAM